MDDRIREILKQTDAAFEKRSSGADVSQKVRRRLARQRRTRVVLAGIVAGIFAMGLVFVNRPRNQQIAVVKAIAPPPIATPVDETDLKVDQLVANLVAKHEKEAVKTGASQADEYLWKLEQERDRTGLILIASGDRSYREFGDRSAAEANYRQVVWLFPDSPAAATARQRLQDISE